MSLIHNFSGTGLIRARGSAQVTRTITHIFSSSGGLTFRTGGYAHPVVAVMTIAQVPRLGKFLLHSGNVDIPCIKTSNNIIEINDGIPSISCYVQGDRTVMTLDLTIENDPFFLEDNEKRIFSNVRVTVT